MTDFAERWPGIDEAELRRRVERLDGEFAEDVALTQACALGHSKAIAELDAILKDEATRAVRPLNAALVDEAAQVLRERLLLPSDAGVRRISDFRGDGALRAWLRAAAVRTALNLQRAGGLSGPALDEIDAPLAASDPELELFRAQHRELFRAAFAAAVAALSERDRTVLRLHTLDALTLARIGTMYRKDTSTVSRWLDAIRGELRAATRRELATRLSVSAEDLDSILRVAEVEVSVSLARLLEK